MNKHEPSSSARNILRALGLVFGDIGTSPIYTFNVILLTVLPTFDNILGILSLLVWTMIIVVTGQYAWLAMEEAVRGEGGPMVLRERLSQLLPNGHKTLWLTFMLHLAMALLLGDGVITPAISILSAVEGLTVIPGWETIAHWQMMAIAIAITIGLFTIQRHGSTRVSDYFGPIMVLWFIVLFTSGVTYIREWPSVWRALNPMHGAAFLFHNGWAGLFILSQVLLCATGGEALFSDIGHVGRKPIRVAWGLVFVALVTNYLGQGAYVQLHPTSDGVLFHLFRDWLPALYVPLLLLTCIATVIASQAVISSVFSVIYQMIGVRLFPTMRVEYTSTEMKTQIYLPAANWVMCLAVIGTLILFQSSSALANAYGLAVIGTMTITAIFLIHIFALRRDWIKFFCAALILLVDMSFLISSSFKVESGGYWSLILAAVPLFVMQLYDAGSRRVRARLTPMPLEKFIEVFKKAYVHQVHLRGEGLFASGSLNMVAPYIPSTMFANQILYESNIICQVEKVDHPHGLFAEFLPTQTEGLRLFRIKAGYKEVIDLGEIIHAHGIHPNAIFYGAEDIEAKHWPWNLYAWMRRLCSSWATFYRLPLDIAHGVIQRVRL